MRPEVERVTAGKAICLFCRLLEQTEFPDISVVDALVHGVHLVGEEPPSCLFTKRHTPASISPEHLAAQSTIRRNAMRCSRGVVEPNDLAD